MSPASARRKRPAAAEATQAVSEAADAACRAEPGPEPQREADPQRALPTVLVVDDIPMFRELVASFLTRVARVVQAEDGAQALEVARREHPRLIVADLEMPGMDGADLCRALRADPELAKIPVVVTLPDGHANTRVRAIRAGADDVLGKPLQGVELVGTVHRFLGEEPVRGLPRVAVETPVMIFLDESPARGRTLNLSRGGMFVRTDVALPPRSEWRVRFQLPETTETLEPTAMVVWRSDGSPLGPGLGLRFVELDGNASRTLEEFVYERTPVSTGPSHRA